jgi:pSer/pThr/pTyr-binding forkhead associated (FHA) protein
LNSELGSRPQQGIERPDPAAERPAEPAPATEPAPAAPQPIVGGAGATPVTRQMPDSPVEPAGFTLIEGGASRNFMATVGARIVVGTGPGSSIVVRDPQVSPEHVLIERRGPGWLVRSLDPPNPAWVLDATGRPHPIVDELGLSSGTLLLGQVQLLLHPPQP